ncbi:MAG: sigma-E processing peptidase SpoIIGA [Clostridia bacterium]|nr:sigma-E processing peptidase SpoIIGA [Clostridia bacterium]
MTVYADVLFLVNFCMDLLSLYGAGMILKRKRRSLRLILAALVGGVYGVAEVLLRIDGWAGAVWVVVISLLMCLIAYGRRTFFSTYVVFVGAEAFLGGVMSILYTVAAKLMRQALPSEEEGGTVTFVGFAAALLISILVGILTEKTLNRTGVGLSEVRVTVGGQSLRFSAVCDSGNFLKDPLTDTPVILVSESVPGASWLLSYENPKGYRAIPYESVGGSGLLFGHKPESLSVEYRGRTYRPDALIAVAKGTQSFDGKGGCVPALLLRG